VTRQASNEASDVAGAPARAGPWWRSRWFQIVLSTVVVVLIFGFFFPKVADYGDAWRTIEMLTAPELAVLLIVAAWSIMSYWPMLVAAQPRLRWREAGVANLASTAVANTLPGGGALGVGVTFTMQRSWGLPIYETALAALLVGVWSNFVKLGLPIVALGLLAVEGEAGAELTTAAIIGAIVLVAAVALLALLLSRATLAERIGVVAGRLASAVLRRVHRPPVEGWGDATSRFREETIGILRGRWVLLTATTVVSQLSLFLVLLVALRVVGVSDSEVSTVKVLAAFAFIRLLSAVPITPGGLGVVELGLTAALGSGLDPATKSQIAAAVLLYRGLTWLLPVPLGVGAWMFWRVHKSWLHSPEERRALLG